MTQVTKGTRPICDKADRAFPPPPPPPRAQCYGVTRKPSAGFRVGLKPELREPAARPRRLVEMQRAASAPPPTIRTTRERRRDCRAAEQVFACTDDRREEPQAGSAAASPWAGAIHLPAPRAEPDQTREIVEQRRVCIRRTITPDGGLRCSRPCRKSQGACRAGGRHWGRRRRAAGILLAVFRRTRQDRDLGAGVVGTKRGDVAVGSGEHVVVLVATSTSCGASKTLGARAVTELNANPRSRLGRLGRGRLGTGAASKPSRAPWSHA